MADSRELRDLASDCVHCGFCLPACPTYQLWGEEMDSPRGRIHIITQLLDGAVGTAAALTHLDRCLGCMACVPACPSGVQYNRLIEAARGWAEGDELDRHDADQAEPAAAPDRGGPVPSGSGVSPGDAVSRQGGTVRLLPRRSLRDRAIRAAIFRTFPYPDRLRLLTAPLRAAQSTGLAGAVARSRLVGRLAPEAAAALRVAPARPAAGKQAPAPARLPARTAAIGQRRAVVGMLTGCVQRVFFPHVNAATARVLAAEGCDVVVPQGQGCCGALSLHGGRTAEAARFARQVIDTFEAARVDAVVINAAGCGSAMKEYADLLAGDPAWSRRAAAFSARVRDFSEFLAELGPVAQRHPLPIRAAYHDACHLGHAQRITRQPRALLSAIPDLTVCEIADGGTCCGSAGIYNLVQPEAAAELGVRKAANVIAADAELLVSANPGCSLQISQALANKGTSMPVAHVAEVLDASISGSPAASLLGALTP